MRRIVTAAAFGVAIGLGSATAQPLGLGTSPQGTLTYALGASVAKVLGERRRHMQSPCSRRAAPAR